MGRQIVKQPNGKYAIWSTVVDDFVWVDCDDVEDIIDAYVQDARPAIESHVRRVCEKLERGEKPYFQFTKSYDECIEIRKRVHGKST